MKQQTKTLLRYLIPVLLFYMVVGGFILHYLVFDQYNIKLVNRYIGDFWVKEIGFQEIGKEGETAVITYNITKPKVTTLQGDSMELDVALDSKKLSLKDIYQGAWSKEKKMVEGQEVMVYFYGTYQIVALKEKCIIAPLETDLEILLK